MNPIEQDITKMSLTELKALAYDQFAMIETYQNNMKLINAEIKKHIDKIAISSNGQEVSRPELVSKD